MKASVNQRLGKMIEAYGRMIMMSQGIWFSYLLYHYSPLFAMPMGDIPMKNIKSAHLLQTGPVWSRKPDDEERAEHS